MSSYYQKYIKYREKYINLKNKLVMTGGSENKIYIYKDLDNLDMNIIKGVEDLVTIHRRNIKNPNEYFKIHNLISELKYSNSKEYQKILNNSKISLIIDSGKVIAICRGVYKPYNNSVYISMVHVLESYRGKGLCTQVVDNLIKSYKDIKYFGLNVLKNNTPAYKCYLKLGFEVRNEKTEEKVYWMVKDII
jgi:ribosomal protein S18 acetylase RimI-like enzyme